MKKSGENRERKYMKEFKMGGNGDRLLLSPHEKDNGDEPSDIYREAIL